MVFVDRSDAGKRLAQRLGHLSTSEPLVVGLPRGGVPVALEVARALDARLDVIVVRKLGVPSQPELGMGAIGEGGIRVLNEDIIRSTRVSVDELESVERRERVELARRAERFRRGRERIPLLDRVVVIVDDGVATGSTARAACSVARAEGAQRVVLAVPVAPADWEDLLSPVADELVTLLNPADFRSVGLFYENFSQTSDDEVVDCLRASTAARD